MSFDSYKDGEYESSWDFQCPECGVFWNNEGDPITSHGEVEDECPGCHRILLISAEYSVDYELRMKEPYSTGKTEAIK